MKTHEALPMVMRHVERNPVRARAMSSKSEPLRVLPVAVRVAAQFVGLGVVDELFLGRIPLELSAQKDRQVAHVKAQMEHVHGLGRVGGGLADLTQSRKSRCSPGGIGQCLDVSGVYLVWRIFSSLAWRRSRQAALPTQPLLPINRMPVPPDLTCTTMPLE